MRERKPNMYQTLHSEGNVFKDLSSHLFRVYVLI